MTRVLRVSSFRQAIGCTASLLGLLAVAAPVAAQITPIAAPAEDPTVVIVTGQKRRENLQKVAASAVALTSDVLRAKGIASTADLQKGVPSLSITEGGFTQNVNIRGIGLSANTPLVSNGVATYLDGLFQPQIAANIGFYDLGSVEVFRGPQGTFVGSNSTGGAIFINSTSPTTAGVNGYVEGGLGDFGETSVDAAVNLPMNDTLAFRIAVHSRSHDAYFTDTGPYHNEPGRLDETGLRLSALWKPTSQFQALLKLQSDYKSDGGFAYSPIAAQAYGAYGTGKMDTVSYDTPVYDKQRGNQASLELKYQFANDVTFRFVSGYQEKAFKIQDDYDATNAADYLFPDTLFLLPATEYNKANEIEWTDEVNLISPTTGRFSWIVGAYYQRSKINSAYDFLVAGLPTDIDTITYKKTTGIFAQGTYKITPDLTLDVGLRTSSFETSGLGAVVYGRGIISPDGIYLADAGGHEKDSKPTGKIALNWTVDKDNLIYGFVTRGYKAGGFSSAVTTFRPETVTDYELGWKSNLLDNHVKTQIGAFYYKYKDFQYNLLNIYSGSATPGNVADATIKGLEASFQAKYGDLSFDGGVSFISSELAPVTFIDLRAFGRAYPGAPTYPDCSVTASPLCYDYSPFVRTVSGSPNLYSPNASFNIGGQYTFHVGSATLTPRLSYAFIGEQYAYIGYDPATDLIKAYGLLNGQISYDFGRYNLTAYVKNITDQRYITGQYNDNQFYGMPRTLGVRLRVSY